MPRILRAIAFTAIALLAGAATFPPVVPGRAITFPRDAGSHPEFRIEWWYVTGHLDTKRGPMGFQVTFFRAANAEAQANPSRFAARQLLFAHAALSDPSKGKLLHDQRSARVLEGLVEASTTDTDVRIDDWTLKRDARDYTTHIEGEGFALDLALTPTQPVLLEGDRGFSRKGPSESHASYYYSEPQLAVRGRIVSGKDALDVSGTAWLDHEWSSEMLASDALGWDWVGLNLDGGGALMAFRIRGRDGASLWSSATLRTPDGSSLLSAPYDVRFRPRRTWSSPRTGTDYPVAMDVEIDGKLWRLDPLMDDQELDARASTGTLYWEGAVRVEGPDGTTGHGYLELTGYGERLKF
ncbi:MAG TPA: lipocalin-like domain-containing protein [Usitatibacter sp.]|nr:lipocalin-like domain-containing protein [Usitatibacter sp.]